MLARATFCHAIFFFFPYASIFFFHAPSDYSLQLSYSLMHIMDGSFLCQGLCSLRGGRGKIWTTHGHRQLDKDLLGQVGDDNVAELMMLSWVITIQLYYTQMDGLWQEQGNKKSTDGVYWRTIWKERERRPWRYNSREEGAYLSQIEAARYLSALPSPPMLSESEREFPNVTIIQFVDIEWGSWLILTTTNEIIVPQDISPNYLARTYLNRIHETKEHNLNSNNLRNIRCNGGGGETLFTLREGLKWGFNW